MLSAHAFALEAMAMMELLEALCRERAQLKAERSQLREQRKRLERSPDPNASEQVRQLEELERVLRERRRGLKRLLVALSLSSNAETSPEVSAPGEWCGELLALAHQEVERAKGLCSLSVCELDGLVRAPLEAMDAAQRREACERLKRAKQTLRKHRKSLEKRDESLPDATRLEEAERLLRAWRKLLESSLGREGARERADVRRGESAQEPRPHRVSKQRLCKLEPARRAELCVAEVSSGFRCERCGLIGPERFLCRPRPIG